VFDEVTYVDVDNEYCCCIQNRSPDPTRFRPTHHGLTS